MPSYPGFIGPSYQSVSYMADAERLINRFPEANESSSAPSPWVLLQCPGFRFVAQPPSAALGRGIFSQNGITLFVAGNVLYSLNADNSVTARATLAGDANPCTFMTNGDAGSQVGVTSGNQFYVVSVPGFGVTPVTTTGATMCGFLDGFGFILDASSSTLQVTNFENFLVVNPGNIAQRTAGSDPWRALYIVNRLAYLLGERTSEVWWNNGGAPFPLAPIQEGFMQEGIGAPFSGARLDTSLLWVSHNDQGRGKIVAASGYTPQRVSTHAVEASLQTYSTLADAIGFSYQENGHTFYTVTFPTAQRTWCYDQSSSLFHERLYWNTTLATWTAYRPGFACSDTARNLVQDRATGAIYEMTTQVFTDVDGAMIRRLRQPPRLSFDQRRFITNSIELIADKGNGLVMGQGALPQVMRRTSKDGGKTWGNEHWATSGPIGAFGTRIRWTQCGQARNRVDEFVDTDPVFAPWVDCVINVTLGTS